MRQSVVQIEVDDLGPKFDLVFQWPKNSSPVGRATQAQRVAVKRFFSLPSDDLKFDEATALLDYRDYARAAVSVLTRGLDADQTFFMERCIAAYIGSDEACGTQVSQWAARRFAGSADPQTAAAGLKRSKAFPKVSKFFIDFTSDIEDVSPGFFPAQQI